MPVITAYSVSLAVVAGEPNEIKETTFDLNYGQFFGTAFCLAPDLFLTACHVYENAMSRGGQVALARLGPGPNQTVVVEDAEVFNGMDLAILKAPGLRADILPFHFGPLDFLQDVFSVGYAFGFDVPVSTSYLRAFKGYVVTRRTLNMQPWFSGDPPGYEISFVPPVGLSGSPLIARLVDDIPMVVGMILKEHTAKNGAYEMKLGLALDISELLTLDSRLAGGGIAELMFRRPRLAR